MADYIQIKNGSTNAYPLTNLAKRVKSGNLTASGNTTYTASDQGTYLFLSNNNGMALFTVWGGSTMVKSISKGEGDIFTYSASHPGIKIANAGSASNLSYVIYFLFA